MAKLAIQGGSPVRDRPYPPWPQAGPEELEELRAVLDSGLWSSTHGNAVKRFERRFAEYHGAAEGVCVSSGEAALRLALEALELAAGGEVIIPAYTFVASATAVLQAGGRPVFADVEPDTYCLDVVAASEMVGPDTAAVMPVHMGGLPADMQGVRSLANEHGLLVVEDAAQAWGATFDGRPVGALGDAGAFSFQASKNITAGEGGIIVTDDAAVAATCRSLVDCGRVATGQRYQHVRQGGNYRMTEFQGAVLNAQLGRYPEQLRHRDANARELRTELEAIPGVAVQAIAAGRTHAWHLIVVRVDTEQFAGAAKQQIVEALVAEGVPATAGYLATPYEQPAFQTDDRVRHGSCPVAERACNSGAVWFRQTALLGEVDDALDVARALAKVRENAAELLEG